MNALIEVFRMNELSPEARIKVIIKLGDLINMQYGSNITEGMVYELVKLLDPVHPILNDPHYTARIT